MANNFIKAEKVVNAGLGVLERKVLLGNLILRDAGIDFAGAKGDTVTVKVPAYTKAKKRNLRAAGPITIDYLAEKGVDVKLATDIYGGKKVTDENMTLDIADFGVQVLNPCMSGVGRGCEEEIADAVTGATFAHEVDVDPDDVYDGLLDGDAKLNNSHVPNEDRILLVGSSIKKAILKDLKGAQGFGARDAAISRAIIATDYAGFTVYGSSLIAPDEAYGLHKTAFVTANRAPLVPLGVTWGKTAQYNGFALRVIMDYDPDYQCDRVVVNSWMGCSVVYDEGELDENGVFQPFETEEEIGSGTPILVRAVKFTLGS